MFPIFRFAILDNSGNPIECSPKTWTQWFETNPEERFIAKDKIGELEISTVFIGCKTFFETCVFNVEGDILWERRCDTRREALENHATACSFED